MLSHLLALIVSQTELTPTWGGLATQLGVAGAVAAILGWQLSLRVKELKDERDQRAAEIRSLREQHAAETRELRGLLAEKDAKILELAERALPALVEVTRTLDATRQHDGADLNRVLRQLERITEDMPRGK